jgi:putative phage-type endonuclease
MLTDEQIKERVNYIGASDCAAALGMSRWGSPLSVWAEKTGLLPPKDLSDNLAVELGNELEDFVARKFMKETGKKVHRVTETLIHPVHSFIRCNLDRRVVGEKAILQCKTASAYKKREWDDEEIPHEYILQELHELAVSGMDRAYLAVLIGNSDFKIKIIERDEKAQSDIVKRLVHFWKEFVEPKVMPEAGRHDKDTLSGLFPVAEAGKEIALDNDAVAICEVLEGMKEDAGGLRRQIEEQENKLKAMLKDADIGIAGAYTIRWQNVPAWSGEIKKSAYRKLTFNKKTEETNGKS